MLEDYRAGLNIDRARRGGSPCGTARVVPDDRALVVEDLYSDVLGVWRPWAADLRGLESEHHAAEVAPEALAAELLAFLG